VDCKPALGRRKEGTEQVIDVVLNDEELREADAYAEQVERETAARNASPTQVGIRRSQSWGNKMGYRAQRAFCKALGIRWSPKAAFDGPNVGSLYKVRGSQRRAGIVAALKVTARDRDDLIFGRSPAKTGSYSGQKAGLQAATLNAPNGSATTVTHLTRCPTARSIRWRRYQSIRP
jgi:hypothetical protein